MEELRRAQASTSRAIAQAKAQHAAAQTDRVQQAFSTEGPTREAWRAFDRAFRPHSQQGPSAVQDASGRLACSAQDIAEAFASHYAAVGDKAKFGEGAGFDEAHCAQVEAAVAAFAAAPPAAGDASLDAPITVGEIRSAVARLKDGTSGSPVDRVAPELIKYGRVPMIAVLYSLFSLWWDRECSDSVPGTVVSIHKAHNVHLPTNYRPITLLSPVDKMYHSVLNTRLQRHLEAQGCLHEAQAGFRKHRSCADHIFTLSQTVLGRRRAGRRTYVLFLDIQKAYDTVWREGMLYRLWHMGVQGKMWRVIRGMYQRTESRATHASTLSEPFTTDLGLAQGDTLSPTLYTVFINGLLEELWQSHPGVQIGEADAEATDAESPPTSRASGPKVVTLAFADDTASLADTVQELQAMADTSSRYFAKWRVKANVSKSAVMCFGGADAGAGEQPVIRWEGEVVPVMQMYKYLGVILSSKAGDWGLQIEAAMGKGERAAKSLAACFRSHRISPWLKRLMYMSLVRPVVEAGAQVWAPTATQARQLNTRTLLAWLKRTFRCPMSTPSEPLVAELGMRPMDAWLRQRMIEYRRLLQHMNPDRLPKQVLAAHWPQRGAGRHPATWAKRAEEALAALNLSADELTGVSLPQLKSKVVKATEGLVLRSLGATRAGREYREHLCPKVQFRSPASTLAASSGVGMGPILLMQLRTGSLPVRESLALRSREGVSLCCPACGAARETPAHFLTECPSTQPQRDSLLAALSTSNEDFSTKRPTLSSTELFWALLGGDGFKWSDEGIAAIEGYIAHAWSLRAAAVAQESASVAEESA